MSRVDTRVRPDNAARARKAKYGIRPEDYDAMIWLQDNRCANPGCRRELANGKATHVDHDHATGKIRGILCGPCNMGIGLLKHSPAVMAGAIEYLEVG